MRRAANGLKAAFRVSLLAALLGVASHPAEAYPDRPIHVILPFAAGGVGDVVTRLVADKLGDKLGQRLVVENYPGPGGINAARAALQAPADGYTMTYMAAATAMSVNLFEKLPYDPVKDFAAVSSLGSFDLVFVCATNSPYKTVGDFLKAAKEKPGQLNVGTILAGSSQHLGVELLKSTTGLDFAVVPYRSSGEVLVALERGDVQMVAEFYAPLRGGLEANKFVAIGTSGAKRAAYLPNVPTMKESGAGDFVVTSWSGLFVRAGASQSSIETLNTAMKAVLSDPEIKKKALDLGIELDGSSPESLHERLVAEIPKWRAVIERARIEVHKGQQ